MLKKLTALTTAVLLLWPSGQYDLCAQPNLSTAYGKKIVEAGYDASSVNDLSDQQAILIGEPTLGYVNINKSIPSSKTADVQATLEFYDGAGNYFKKKIILNGQGNTTLGMSKHNFKVAFCEDDWIADATTDITIGDWVEQDEFHFKSGYLDQFRDGGMRSYKLWDQATADRQKPWEKMGIATADPNAKGHPDGFPCMVYVGGNFNGIYIWALRKHRSNMGMKKAEDLQIHIDGKLLYSYNGFWGGIVPWKNIELKNPKKLYTTETETVYTYEDISKDDAALEAMGTNYTLTGDDPEAMTGLSASSPAYYRYDYTSGKGKAKTKYYRLRHGKRHILYDNDAPVELLSDSTAGLELDEHEVVVRSAKVRKAIQKLSSDYRNIIAYKNAGATTQQLKDSIEKVFDTESLIDYLVFSLVTGNYDGWLSNWQWVTYDGQKWFVLPYDLDCTYGVYWNGRHVDQLPAEWTSHYKDYKQESSYQQNPFELIRQYYWSAVMARYSDLRQRGIYTSDNICRLAKDWSDRIGEENYDMEWQAFDPRYDSYWHKHTEERVNAGWEHYTSSFTNFDYNYQKRYYNASSTYTQGNIVSWLSTYWIRTASTPTSEVPIPDGRLGFWDDINRLAYWCGTRLKLLDDYIGSTYANNLKTTFTFTIGEAGYSTLYVAFDFAVPAGLQLYTVTGIDGDKLIVRPQTKGEGRVGYLVEGEPGSYTISGTYKTSAGAAASGNWLKGTTSTIHVASGNYVLQSIDGEVGFYKVLADDQITLTPHKAYLAVPDSSKKASISLSDFIEDDEAGIGSVTTDDDDEATAIYSASGARQQSLAPGLNVVRYRDGHTAKVWQH